MIRLSFNNIDNLRQTHFEAVESYVFEIMSDGNRKAFYDSVMALPGMGGIDEDDHTWLERFILADVNTLKSWTANNADSLQFDFMKKLYINRFSNGTDNYVDKAEAYNAYTLFRLMNISVCPYCEHEYIQEVTIAGKKKRTIEFDHFFPKGEEEYPALAMCFYNLIPSCKPCNQLKMTNKLAANPYEDDIEFLTCLRPDLPVGVNMSNVSPDQCEIRLHPKGGMVLNDVSLALQQRYKTCSPEVHRLLLNSQNYPDEKLEELERLGVFTKEEMKYSLFGNPRNKARGKELHTKMKEDLIGY